MRAMLALCATLGACAPALRYTATTTEVLAEGSLVCDGFSTSYAMREPKHYGETNPMLGQFPSDARLTAYFGTIGATTFAANRALGRWPVARILLNVVVLGIEQDAVRSNMDVGVPLCGM
jgi:hypothetical protein